MDEVETIKLLREQNKQLRLENELLKAKIIGLEARQPNMKMHILHQV